jgi:hypothetical protein
MAEISWPWLLSWLFVFTGLGFGIGWSFKGLMVERHEHDRRDDRKGGVYLVCPVCGFDNFPEGGMHAAYSIHMNDHERRGWDVEEDA